MLKNYKNIIIAFLLLLLNNFIVIYIALELMRSHSYSKDDPFALQPIIEKALLSNPSLLEKSLMSVAQHKQEDEETYHLLEQVQENNALKFGHPHGKIKIIQFSDYNCPPCKNMAKILNDIIANDSDIELYFVHIGFVHYTSILASKIILALKDIDLIKAKELHFKFFNHNTILSRANLYDFANNIGISNAQLDNIMSNDNLLNIDKQLDMNLKLFDQMNFSTVPAFIVGNVSVPHSISKESLLSIIQRQKELRHG